MRPHQIAEVEVVVAVAVSATEPAVAAAATFPTLAAEGSRIAVES